MGECKGNCAKSKLIITKLQKCLKDIKNHQLRNCETCTDALNHGVCTCPSCQVAQILTKIKHVEQECKWIENKN